MINTNLKSNLPELVEQYADSNNCPADRRPSAILFKDPLGNLHPASAAKIKTKAEWLARTKKPHQNVAGMTEMMKEKIYDTV